MLCVCLVQGTQPLLLVIDKDPTMKQQQGPANVTIHNLLAPSKAARSQEAQASWCTGSYARNDQEMSEGFKHAEVRRVSRASGQPVVSIAPKPV